MQVSLTGSNVQKDGKLRVNPSVGELFQPTTINTSITPTVGSRRPKWRDNNGVLWATHSGNLVQKSLDNGTTWTTVLTITGGDLTGCGLMVTSQGRILVGDYAGKQVLISDTAQTTYTQAFAYTNQSYWNYQMSHCMYDNVIIIGSYDANAVGANARNEVWMSLDYGSTWNKIFTAPILDPTRNCHIHDVEYDPWDKRIYIGTGDEGNKNIFYSDDLGATWTTVFPSANDPKNQQPAQIVAYSHGIIFGSDSTYEGLHYWPKNGVVQAPVNPNDIILDFYKLSPYGKLRNFASRKWVVRDKDMQLTLLPFYATYPDGMARILASQDGLTWHEIFKHTNSTDPGFHNIIGPTPNDPLRKIVGTFKMTDGSYSIFNAQVPEFVQDYNNKRKVQIDSKQMEVVYINATTSGNVNTASTQYVDVIPPDGYVYEIESISMEVVAPPGATTGTQEISVSKGPNSRPSIIFASYAYNKDTSYNMGEFTNATSAQPSNTTNQAANIRALTVSTAQWLRLNYTNKTDVVQTNPRTYNITARKVKVIQK